MHVTLSRATDHTLWLRQVLAGEILVSLFVVINNKLLLLLLLSQSLLWGVFAL